MITINLLPQKKKLFGPLQTHIIIYSVIIILVVFVFQGYYGVQKHKLTKIKESISDLEKNLVQLNEISKKVDKLEKDKLLLVKRMDIIRRLVVDRNMWPRLFDDICNRLPNGVWMINFVQTEEKMITISGFSFNNLNIARFMQSLEKSPYIEKVDLDYAQKISQGEDDTVKFQIMLSLNRNI